MHGERIAFAVASTAIALSVSSVSGLAQSDAVRWRTSLPDLTAAVAISGDGVFVQASVASDPLSVPSNLEVPATYKTTVDTMLQRSPMFRRQAMRLAAAPHLTVRVRTLSPMSTGPRARTQISRDDDGWLIARVEINPLGDFVELLAHELEHVIEQLDGIDLAAKAALANSGVRSCVDGTFETSRAVRIGMTVAHEARLRR